MKITFVSDTYFPQINGVATTLLKLVLELRKIGHEVDIIRPSNIQSNEEGLEVPSFSLPGYKEVRVGLPVKSRLKYRWKYNRPDVVYVATETPLGYSAVSAAISLKILVVTGFHTNFQQYVSCYKFPFLSQATTIYLRRIHNKSNCTFVPSMDSILKLDDKGFKNLKLLLKGVDTEMFSPAKWSIDLRKKWGVKNNDLVGIYVGRVAVEKNLDLLIETFSRVSEEVPNFKGIIVGDGPKLEKLKVTFPQFIYSGPLKGEELASYYASSDVFIFPSLTETFGNVTLEAMSSGLAVLAFDYAAANYYIKDEENGFVVEFGNEEAFVKKAIDIFTTKNIKSIKEKSRERVLNLSWSNVIKDFQNNLFTLLDNHNKELKQSFRKRFYSITKRDIYNKIKKIIN